MITVFSQIMKYCYMVYEVVHVYTMCGCVCCMCVSQLVTSFLMWCYYLVDTTDRHTHTRTHTPHMQYMGDVLSAYAGTPGM